jgi:hypothetical protein
MPMAAANTAPAAKVQTEDRIEFVNLADVLISIAHLSHSATVLWHLDDGNCNRM